MRSLATLIFFMAFVSIPVFAQEASDTGEEPLYRTWSLPGAGAGALIVNSADGSIWTFMHQTHNLVALDGNDGAVLLDIPLDLSPTSLAFAPAAAGSVGFIVGEPMSDQIISQGVIEAFDTKTGGKIAQLELDGACNAVYIAADGAVYVATGMQYGYPGKVYRLSWDPVTKTFSVEAEVETGKIPWALTVYDGNLYVTDLELQWTAQPDGSVGPPYGCWVWVYEVKELVPEGKIWVGINPTDLAGTRDGVLVACSGSKQTQGLYEPAVVLLKSPDPSASEFVFIGTCGVTDIAVPDSADFMGDWALATLADFIPAPSFSAVSQLSQALPGFPQPMRWVFTGELALIEMSRLQDAPEGENPNLTLRINIVDEAHLRWIALSPDASTLYALRVENETAEESVLAIPVADLMNLFQSPE
jgi:hypothetical protein